MILPIKSMNLELWASPTISNHLQSPISIAIHVEPWLPGALSCDGEHPDVIEETDAQDTALGAEVGGWFGGGFSAHDSRL